MKAVNNRYRLVKCLKRGVVSNLYLARDLSEKRRVVLKTVKMSGFREEITGYFRHSFLQASRLVHPNLARIHDFGEISSPKKGQTSRFSLELLDESLGRGKAAAEDTEQESDLVPEEDEICFFAIEYLRGRNLWEATESGCDWEMLYEVIAQLCAALDYVHARGMTHYAIKPTNVLLIDDERGFTVKLADLGISPPNPITREAYLQASAEFGAPELFVGAAVDRRVDLYALGVCLYQVIARRLPFTDDDPAVLAAAHVSKAPEPFDKALAVPPELEQLVMRLLAKRPAERYPRARALLEELARITGKPFAVPEQTGGHERLLAGRFVGRRAECERIREPALTRPSCLLVEGPAGCGKTHLIREMAGRGRGEHRSYFWGFFYSSSALFYRPFSEILWQMGQRLGWSGRLLEQFRTDLSSLLPHMLREDEGCGRRLPTAPSERVRLFENVSRFWLAFARERPSVIHIENVHLADEWGIQFLEHLIRALGEARRVSDPPDLTIVLTGRSGVRSRTLESLRGLMLESLVERISLEPLGPDEVSRLIASLLGMDQPPTRFGNRVWEIGRGNPLYTKEVVRLLVEEGRLFFEDVWKIDAPDPQGIELVGELKEILRRRLAKLDERAREALIFLALIERPVNLSGAITLLRWEPHEAVQALHELRGRKILYEDNVQGDLMYHLRHELLRDVALEMLSSEELDHYREAVFSRMPALEEAPFYPEEVAWFAQRSDSAEICLASARRARRLGHAAQAAAEYARADEGLGQDVGRRLACRVDWARALIQDRRGEEALRVLQGVEALVLTHNSEAAIACRLLQIWLLIELGQLEEARRLHDYSESLLSAATDPLQLGELRFLRSGLDWAQWRVDPSEGFDGAMATLERAGDRAKMADVRGRLLSHRFFLWGHPRAEVILVRALGEHRTPGHRERTPYLLRALAEHDLAYGDYGAALEHFQKSLEAAEAAEDYREVVTALLGLGRAFCLIGEADKARHYADHAGQLAIQFGDDLLAAHACFLEGRIELLIGRNESAFRTFEQAVDWYQSAGARRRWCYAAATTLSTMLLWLGHKQRADRWAEVTAAYRGQGYASDIEGHDHFCQGLGHLLGGETEQAVDTFQAGLEVARGGLIVEAGWKLRYGLARARQAMGDLQGARAEVEEAERILAETAERVPANLRATYGKVWYRQEVQRYREELFGEVTSAARSDRAGGELERVVEEYRDEIEGLQLNQLRELKGNLEKLLAINKKINSELNVDKLLEQIMDHAIELTRAERGVLILAENGSLSYPLARDYQRRAIPDPESQISRSIAEQVIRDGRALVTTNALEDQRLDEYQSVTDLRLHSVLCVPLRERDRMLGALYIDNRFEKGVFVESDRQLLEAFADQAAIALGNAWLHEENRKRADDLAVSNQRIEKLNERLERFNRQLEEKVEHQSAEIVEIREELQQKQSELETKYNYQNIVGSSDAMQAVFRLLDRVTDNVMPVYIHGESGTGKELVARAIHFNGPRRNNRFAVENCAALTETLLESELFGYVKGAFTGADRDKKGLFEVANGGTIFFDEVGDMSNEMQKKLLRVLQEGEVRRVGGKEVIPIDVRIISASNKDLAKMVEEGTFREDLYYRLNVLRIDLPPLRDRRDDVIAMVDLFLEELAEMNRLPKRQLTADVEKVLRDYHWPGNVRELRNVVTGVVALTDKEVLTGEDFAQKMPQARERKPSVFDELMSIDEYTQHFIATWQEQYNDTELAKLLGVSRKTLWEKRKRFGISKP